MKESRTVFAATVVLLVLAAATAARAEDFTFVVPVALKDLHPNITQGNVACIVSKAAGNPSAQVNVVGGGNTSFDITGGRYSGNVTVKFDAKSGYDPAEAARYRCELRLKGRGWDLPAYMASSESHPQFVEEARLAPGSPFRGFVEGPLHTGPAQLQKKPGRLIYTPVR